MFKLQQGNLNAFMATLSSGRTVYALSQVDLQYHLVRAEAWDGDQHLLGSYRPVEPLKGLFFPPRETVGRLREDSPLPEMRERIVIGVKNCDLSALKIHDYVFLECEPRDPFYAQAREKTVIISCDCTDARESCFCPAVDEQPYARAGFDINLSPIGDGFIVEPGSEKGEALLDRAGDMLSPVSQDDLSKRDANRYAVTRRVAEQAEGRGLTTGADLQAAVRASEDADMWDVFARDCVECGACNFVCCTCHCFLLADGSSPAGGDSRVKKWDSCLYHNFARVAGGANPRKHRADRLFNRFDKKFVFFPEVLGRYACDGCGRCAEACTGKIDIRDVLKKALDGQ
ncbi:MAG: 4Fe-4S dicluster domain-containing protein [Kiritimatiellae bacterium]|nr:4Fe-4S dicluster domain-containing protein [Kiritimatiellia bacterium]